MKANSRRSDGDLMKTILYGRNYSDEREKGKLRRKLFFFGENQEVDVKWTSPWVVVA